MAELSYLDKAQFEKLFGMEGGYVLDFSNPSFETFFRDYKVDIFSSKYEKYGTSKAKRLRSFWEMEENKLVGECLGGLLDYCEYLKFSDEEVKSCRVIVDRLLGRESKKSKETFLDADFQFEIAGLGLDESLSKVIEQRLAEIYLAFGSGAYLSVIFLCGSTLEGILLNNAEKEPMKFNSATSAPKDKVGKPKRFHEWSLACLINVAYEIDLISKDVKDYASTLRSFRNYIHPYQQRYECFFPDEHTAKISLQVLKAALAQLSR